MAKAKADEEAAAGVAAAVKAEVASEAVVQDEMPSGLTKMQQVAWKRKNARSAGAAPADKGKTDMGSAQQKEMPSGLTKMQQVAWKRKNVRLFAKGVETEPKNAQPQANEAAAAPKPKAEAEPQTAKAAKPAEETPNGEQHQLVEVDIYVALQTFACEHDGDLALAIGDRVVVIDKQADPWWRGYVEADAAKQAGLFPSNFVTPVSIGSGPSAIDVLKEQAAKHVSVGDFASAVLTLEKAVELDPENCDTLKAKALTHADALDFASAISILDEALELQPKNDEILAIKQDVIQKASMAERIAELTAMATDIFQVFDADESGDLNIEELGALMFELDFACDAAYLNAIATKFGHTDAEGRSAIGVDEFKEIMRLIAPGIAKEAEEKENRGEAGPVVEGMPTGLTKLEQIAWKKKNGRLFGKGLAQKAKLAQAAKLSGKGLAKLSGKFTAGKNSTATTAPAASRAKTADAQEKGAVSGKVYVAHAPFEKQEPDDLGLRVGDRVVVLSSEGEWWSGYLESDGAKTVGNFPCTFVDEAAPPPPSDEEPPPAPADEKPGKEDGRTVGTQIDGGQVPRYCKKCKLVFTATACPGGHANFMYTKTLPT